MNKNSARDELLAYVAEKYYQDDLKQTEIAAMIGVTRSAVSRMLTEARQKDLVEIIIHHPYQFSPDLEEKLQKILHLQHVSVVAFQNQATDQELKKHLGKAGSRLMVKLIKPGDKIGLSWGTSIQSTIEAFEAAAVLDARVVQLVGVLGSTRHSYSAQILVEQLAHKINGEGIYLYSPFIVENGQTAASLLEDPAVFQALSTGRRCDLALVGIGSTKAEFCSLFKENHISHKTLQNIQEGGAVGDVCGLYFDINGNLSQVDFHQRRIGISLAGLRGISLRLGVAGNPEKAEAILGAARGEFINALVTDTQTARKVLELAQGPEGNE